MDVPKDEPTDLKEVGHRFCLHIFKGNTKYSNTKYLGFSHNIYLSLYSKANCLAQRVQVSFLPGQSLSSCTLVMWFRRLLLCL